MRHTWFKNIDQGETDDAALQQAVNSCSGTCMLLLNGPVFLTKVRFSTGLCRMQDQYHLIRLHVVDEVDSGLIWPNKTRV